MKKLNEKQKKIINIVVTSLQIAVVIIAIVLSVIIIANPNVENAKIGKGNTKLLPVLTNSMAGDKKDSFQKGDLVIAKKPKDVSALKVGDIITFKTMINNIEELNTHRIIEVVDIEIAGKPVKQYITKGDNPAATEDTEIVKEDKVLAVYKFHIKGVGKAIQWLQKPTNFLLVIVLPLLVLFIYNVVLFIRMMMQAKILKTQEQAGSAAAIDEEEIKRQAIADYIASKDEAEQKSKQDKKVEEKKETVAPKTTTPKKSTATAPKATTAKKPTATTTAKKSTATTPKATTAKKPAATTPKATTAKKSTATTPKATTAKKPAATTPKATTKKE